MRWACPRSPDTAHAFPTPTDLESVTSNICRALTSLKALKSRLEMTSSVRSATESSLNNGPLRFGDTWPQRASIVPRTLPNALDDQSTVSDPSAPIHPLSASVGTITAQRSTSASSLPVPRNGLQLSQQHITAVIDAPRADITDERASVPYTLPQKNGSLSTPAMPLTSGGLTSGGLEQLRSIPGINSNQQRLTVPRHGSSRDARFLLPVSNSTPFPAKYLCFYLCAAAPKSIDWVESRIHADMEWSYIAPFLNLGILVQVTAQWFRQKVPQKSSQSIDRSLFCEWYTSELATHGVCGFGVQDPELSSSAHWWTKDKRGDGVVWPSVVGEMVIRWQTPAAFQHYLKWNNGHEV
ncbi:hypothetical protein B0T14DRAFT_129752 [Immersiella caudata]|uniref:Uncharacterized protein n=1 Tax=Immersiella caudata TaxID=314043 RepID=A0AA39X591_9PEZI|nr:hypothetical protein B0T14DRAFT_129752 [Immersiella caudata]